MARPPRPIPMNVGLGPAAVPGAEWAVIDAALAETLATSYQRVFEAVAVEGTAGPEAITADVPNSLAEGLDERGLARVGLRVGPGDLLIGRATPLGGGERTAEEKLLRAIFGEAAGDMRDTSVRVPAWLEGEVREAELSDGEAAGEIARARVVVGWERPLEIGDRIEVAGRQATVTEIRRDAASPVEIGGVPISGEVEVVRHARDVYAARAIGPYSAITQQPVTERESYGGQLVTAGQRAALAGAGARALLAELTGVKSDSLLGRTRCYEALVKGENPEIAAPPPAPAREPEPPPDGMRDIFDVFAKPAAPAIESVEVVTAHLRALGLELRVDERGARLEVAGPEAIRERSHGVVQTPETIDYQTQKPKAGGLMCERVFGPTADYACSCGKYKRMKHRGVVCEKCGVEVIQSRVRRERFGHVELGEPVPHPILAHTGATIEALPIMPPDLRPLVPLRGGRFATSDLNDLYRRVINRNNRLARLIEIEAPEMIVTNERQALAKSVAQLFDNRAGELTGPEGRPLRSLVEVLGELAAKILVKTADYSGTAPLVIDAAAGPRQCRLPRELATELFRPWLYGALEREGYVTTIKSAKAAVDRGTSEALAALERVASATPALLMVGDRVVSREVTLWDHPAVGVDAATARTLGAGLAQIHIPVSEQGRAECRALPDCPEPRPVAASGWLGRLLCGGDAVEALREGAAGGVDPLDDLQLRLAYGLG